MSGAIELAAAQAEVLARATRLGAEMVETALAGDRVLANDVHAPFDMPLFANSAMDGFALRSADVAAASDEHPVRLKIVGESRAGLPQQALLSAGQASRVSTGAAMPAGADCVLRIEDADADAGDADSIAVRTPIMPESDVRPAGDDISHGELAVAAGEWIGAGELAMFAALGLTSVSCVARPRVGIVVTGDELVEPGQPLAPGQIYNSNLPMLRALVTDCGAEITWQGSAVADDQEATDRAIAQAMAASDLTIVCGGVSVGRHDHVKQALANAGAEQVFWQVALRPGHPTWFGVRPADGQLAFGLPGNPVSAFVTFHLFARPALMKLAGRQPFPITLTARLSGDQRKSRSNVHVLRCSLRREGESPDADWIATPTSENQRSHAMSSLVGVDGLAILPVGQTMVSAGECVPIMRIR